MTLFERYRKEIREELRKELLRENPMAVPRVEKVVINVGMGEALKDRSVLEKMAKQVGIITGQRPKTTRAKKSEAGFGLRAGTPVGLKVTLRGKRAYDFLEKLVDLVLPRLRDFQGIEVSSFDKRGNLNLGFEEQTVFPELTFEEIDRVRGLEVTVVTTAEDDREARLLLEKLGFPFKEERTRRGTASAPTLRKRR